MVQLREVLAALVIFVATCLSLAGGELPLLRLAKPIVLEPAGDKEKIPIVRCTSVPLALALACLLVERVYF